MSNAFDLTVTALREQGLNAEEILKELSSLFQKLAVSNNQSATNETTDAKIKKLLRKVCMPTSTKGYKYWVVAIKIYINNDKTLKMKDIYDQIGEIYKDKPSRIARAMRFATESVLDKCPQETIVSAFGSNIFNKKGRITNSLFISVLSEQI